MDTRLQKAQRKGENVVSYRDQAQDTGDLETEHHSASLSFSPSLTQNKKPLTHIIHISPGSSVGQDSAVLRQVHKH